MKLKRLVRSLDNKFNTLLKRHGYIVLVCLAIIAVIIIGVGFTKRDKSDPKTFQTSLSQLISNAQKLQELHVPSESESYQISKDLDDYQKLLTGMENSCNQLLRFKSPDSSDKGKTVGERTAGICKDLFNITIYSGKLHERLHDYLLLSDADWPKADTPQFTKRLDEVTNTLGATRTGLENLNNSKVQDPALNELLYQIKFAQNITDKIKTTTNQTERQKFGEELRIQIKRDKTDFLSARTYFWNNTIGVAQLIKALQGVQDSIPSATAPPRFNKTN